jgi:hypothetical protein
MFEEMIAHMDEDVTRLFMKAEIRQNIRRWSERAWSTVWANLAQ